MGKFDLTGLTINPEEVSQVSELVIEQVFDNSVMSKLHDVHKGIQHKKQILFVKRMPIGGQAANGCTAVELGDVKFSEKFWNPALVEGRFTHCANDENNLFKILKQATKVYPDFFNRLDSPEIKLVIALLTTHMEESILAKVWFSDLAADTIANSGVFTNGTDINIFNQIDGIFKEIFAEAGIKRHTITKNAAVSYVAQKLASGDGHAIIKAVYSNSDSRLKSNPNGQILVTPEIYYNYLDTIEEKEFNGGVVTTLVDGREKVTYKGVEVIRKDDWGRNIEIFQNDGSKLNMPHRVVFTTPANIPIGTLSESDMQNLESFYDAVGKRNIIDYGYFLDAKLGEDYLCSVAY